VHDISPLRDV
jgi:hypothetical protein